MTMADALFWILSVYALCLLLCDSKISIPLRASLFALRPLFISKFFESLFECYFCMGIWVSAGLWALFSWPDIWHLEALKYVLTGAGGAYFLNLVSNVLEAKIYLTAKTIDDNDDSH